MTTAQCQLRPRLQLRVVVVCCRYWAALVSFDIYVSDVCTLLWGFVCCLYWAALVSLDVYGSDVFTFLCGYVGAIWMMLRLLSKSP